MQATDERRAELFVTAHSSAAPAPDRFVADENFRQARPALKSYPSSDFSQVERRARIC